MILPTDPVSVLALFEELGVSERLATIVEGESTVKRSAGDPGEPDAFQGFWRADAEEFGLSFAAESDERNEDSEV